VLLPFFGSGSASSPEQAKLPKTSFFASLLPLIVLTHGKLGVEGCTAKVIKKTGRPADRVEARGSARIDQ
jgi:hypothetical protein